MAMPADFVSWVKRAESREGIVYLYVDHSRLDCFDEVSHINCPVAPFVNDHEGDLDLADPLAHFNR